jgi:hypothetical protein
MFLQSSLAHQKATNEQSAPDSVYGHSIAAPYVRTIAPLIHQRRQLRILQQHNRLAVQDFAGFNHLQRLLQRNLQHLNILSLRLVAATRRNPMPRLILRHKKENPLRHRTRAHVALENLSRIVHDKSRLLLSLLPNAGLRIRLIEQPSARLDEHPILKPIHISREAKLPNQHHRLPLAVVQQHDRAIPAVIRLAPLLLPSTITPQKIKRRLLQHIPIVRQRLHFLNSHSFRRHSHLLENPSAQTRAAAKTPP